MGRAILLDEDTTERLDDTEDQEVDSQTLQDPVQQDTFVAQESAPDEEDDVPDKYRNKSIKDLVRMHQKLKSSLVAIVPK